MTDKTFSDLISEILTSDTFQKFREDPEQLMTAIVSDEDGNGICLYKVEDAIYFLPVMSKPVKIVYENTKVEPLSEDKIKATIYDVR